MEKESSEQFKNYQQNVKWVFFQHISLQLVFEADNEIVFVKLDRLKKDILKFYKGTIL